MSARGMFRSDRRGQALVEFALVMPLLLLLLVGLIEMGRAWNQHQVVTDASREGARKAVISNPTITLDSVRNTVKRGLANGGINPDKPGVVILAPGWNDPTGEPATVTVQVPYEFVFLGPIMSWFTAGWDEAGRTITLTARSSMRNE